MKKIVILLCTIMFILPVNAQKNTQKQEVVEYDLLERSYQQRVDLLKSNDELLNALLKIPFEKRVYVYPALFESHHIPKKIVTHPQILPWKGKKPTRIAPQLQEFAKNNQDSHRFFPEQNQKGHKWVPVLHAAPCLL